MPANVFRVFLIFSGSSLFLEESKLRVFEWNKKHFYLSVGNNISDSGNMGFFFVFKKQKRSIVCNVFYKGSAF